MTTTMYNVGCISDYLSVISEFNISYSLLGTSPVSSRFLYRGLSDAQYAMIPAIFRTSHDYGIKFSGHTDDEPDGFVDNPKYTEYASEKSILLEFIAQACIYINEKPTQDLYKWADYAQHYGVPTRILDWTENPLVALYFACRDNKHDYKDESLGGKNALVWMIHLSNYERFYRDKNREANGEIYKSNLTRGEIVNQLINGMKPIRYPILYQPYCRDQRMSAQASVFMVWGSEIAPFDSFFMEENYLRSNKIDEARHAYDNHKEIISSFKVFAGAKQQILRELDSCGINEKTLFPGLDGIGRYIEMKHRFDLDEAKRL